MRINEHQKKGCEKDVDFEKNPLEFKLCPPLRNIMEGVHLAKGGNILEYNAKVDALSKLRHNRPSSTLALQGVQTFEHKRNKEKTTSLDIHEEVPKEFMVVHKKRFTRHGG
jgi:hypothetical protein